MRAEKLLDSWEFWRAEPLETKAVGDQVAVLVRFRARGRGSGAEVEGHESALFTFRDGKVVRYEWFHGETGAFEALGARNEGNLHRISMNEYPRFCG